jgi:hypothetical protein
MDENLIFGVFIIIVAVLYVILNYRRITGVKEPEISDDAVGKGKLSDDGEDFPISKSAIQSPAFFRIIGLVLLTLAMAGVWTAFFGNVFWAPSYATRSGGLTYFVAVLIFGSYTFVGVLLRMVLIFAQRRKIRWMEAIIRRLVSIYPIWLLIGLLACLGRIFGVLIFDLGVAAGFLIWGYGREEELDESGLDNEGFGEETLEQGNTMLHADTEDREYVMASTEFIADVLNTPEQFVLGTIKDRLKKYAEAANKLACDAGLFDGGAPFYDTEKRAELLEHVKGIERLLSIRLPCGKYRYGVGWLDDYRKNDVKQNEGVFDCEIQQQEEPNYEIKQ